MSSKPVTFTDSMDPTRILQPIGTNGKKFTCKVFFKGRGGALVYSGKVELPAHLFDEKDPRNRYVGFVTTTEEKTTSTDRRRPGLTSHAATGERGRDRSVPRSLRG